MICTPRPIVATPSQRPLLPVEGAPGVSMAVLVGPEQGAPGFVMRRFVVEPGGFVPEHVHDDIEHVQVVIRGPIVMRLGGREHEARAGDCIFIPAATPHRYDNRGSEPAEFICIIPLTDGYTTRWLE